MTALASDAPTFPRPHYNPDTDARAWLDDDEIAMLEAVIDGRISYTLNLKFKGDAGDRRDAMINAHANIGPMLRRIAKLRRELHRAPRVVVADTITGTINM